MPLRKFLALDAASQSQIIQAWWWLGIYRFALRNRPLNSLLTDLRVSDVSLQQASFSAAQLEIARKTGLAISRAATCTPWLSNCLVQVLVARRMLQQQGIGGSLYVGVLKSSEQEQNALKAHAWLACGSEVISGYAGHQDYRVLARQQWP